MIKELFLAILLGALLGFGATGGYYTYKNSQAKNNSDILPAQTTATPTPQADNTSTRNTDNLPTVPPSTNSTNSQLTITSPLNESLVNTPVITLKGTAAPDSMLVIQTPKKNLTAQVDSTGNFSIPNIELEGGINLLQISAFDPQDNQSDIELLVTYSSAKI